MNDLPIVEIASRLGWAVIHSLGQGTLIALVAAVLLAGMRHVSAAGRHIVCLLALVAMFGMFCFDLASIRIVRPGPRAATIEAPAAPVPFVDEAAEPLANPASLIETRRFESGAAELPDGTPVSWRETIAQCLPWLGGLWCAGLALLSLWRWAGWQRVQSWKHRGATAAGVELQRLCERLAREFGSSGTVRLLESTRAVAPMVTGLLRPVILLPARIVTGLGPVELEAILAHELAHLARRDTWANFVQLWMETFLFFHPAVWWLGHRARIEREHATDDLALRLRPERRNYASALVRLAELEARPTAALAATGGNLTSRIRRILGRTPETGGSGAWLAVTFVIVVIGAAMRFVPAHGADEGKVVNVAAGESIQAAIDAAPEGAIIWLDEGEWKERVRISKPLTLEGADWEKTRITIVEPDPAEVAQATADVALAQKAASTPEEKEKASADWVEKVAHPAIWVHDARDVTLRKLRVQGISQRGREDGGTSSVLVYFQRAQAAMSECAVVGPFGNGIHIADESEVEIAHSLVAALWSEGIVVTGAARDGSSRASRLHLVDCDVRNVYHYGIALGPGCDSTVIERCRISGTAWHGIRYDHAAPTITGNIIFANARFGIYASGKTHATVRGNLFWKNEMSGVSRWFDNADVIEGNTFVGNLREGLAVLGGAKPAITRNIFVSNPVAIVCGQSEKSPIGDPALTENLFRGLESLDHRCLSTG